MKKITYDKLERDSLCLAWHLKKPSAKKYKNIYPIPRGGCIVAAYVSRVLEIPITEKLETDSLVIDDLIDSGKTLADYQSNDRAVLYRKPHSPAVDYAIEEIDDWIQFPYEETDKDIKDNVTRILQYIGENPNREGLVETPGRVTKSWNKLFGGYREDPKAILSKVFTEDCDQMVMSKDIELYSTCEHHMLPFYGKCHIAYIPSGKVVGISKLARLVEVFSRRLQIQERLTHQIANAIEQALSPKAVGVIIEAKHMCMMARGIEKQNSEMITSCMLGAFRDDAKAREEMMRLCLRK